MGYKLPLTLSAEIDELDLLIRRFKSGEISDLELKARRVPFGIYEQRVKGRYMARIRCAAGMITPDQLSIVATLAKRYGSGRLHVTTRQEIQMHDLPLENLIPVIRGVFEAGLATRGGGGNTVRNITASWDSGVSTQEAFDVTPYAVGLTSRMIELPGSWLLPRKFKIAFSNSGDDTAYATFNDVGFVACIKDGRKGFKVFVAGGMGRAPQPGQLLHEFIESTQVFEVAEAIKRFFSKYGNRRNKHTARLRYLWNILGREKFIARYEDERRALGIENPEPFCVEDSMGHPKDLAQTPANLPDTPEFLLWKNRYCRAQLQEGYWMVRFPLTLGDLQASDAIEIAAVASDLGEDVLRFTLDQNIVFRNISETYLGVLYELSRGYSPLSASAPVISNGVACAGASTCQLGICLSRGALNAAMEELSRSSLDLDALSDLRIHFSGCFNSCGQHGLADIGFFGKASRKDGHAYPAYTVVAGAIIDSQKGSSLAQTIGEVPARSVPEFLKKFLHEYSERKAVFGSFRKYLIAEGIDRARSMCNEVADVPSFDDNPQWYRDWGADSAFSLEGRGTGECAAGLFDLIELDLAKVKNAREELSVAGNHTEAEKLLRSILFYSARSLLVTKTGEIVQDAELPEEFNRHFVHNGLVPQDAGDLVRLLSDASVEFNRRKEEIVSFADTMVSLYASLDESLQFRTAEHAEPASDPKPDSEADLRGVACPMNFVKTKMALAKLRTGQILKVLLDDGAPIDNVPRSVKAEGHEIIHQEKSDNYWVVIIKKAG